MALILFSKEQKLKDIKMENVEFINTELPDIIELKNITQKYGNNTVIENLNVLIEDKPERGQFVSILGSSGCGKSTILRFIAGLQTPTSGEVFLHEKIRTKEDQVGMVFQQYSSFPWMTVIDNVSLPLKYEGMDKKERYEKAEAMLKVCGLENHKDKFAQYPTLSGGQLQRVAIARSLIANPNILLMDEPFGALDINTRLAMQDMLINIWEKYHPTVVFVTHDIQEAVYLSDEIIIMSANPGKIVYNIDINLPYHRDYTTKRTKGFLDHVYDIEDKMMEVHAYSEQLRKEKA